MRFPHKIVLTWCDKFIKQLLLPFLIKLSTLTSNYVKLFFDKQAYSFRNHSFFLFILRDRIKKYILASINTLQNIIKKPIKCVFYKKMLETLKQHKTETWDYSKLELSQFDFFLQGHKWKKCLLIKKRYMY